jgi:enoyl-CoA hydratase/carnithine racemase
MIRYSASDGIATALLDREDKLNAMDRPFWAELEDCLAGAAADPAVRVLIFRGAGRCFSVGGDIAGFGAVGGSEDRRAFIGEALKALRAVDDFPKPTIAAVHGHALGGGCELTMVCDIVVADETASFATPEASVGLVPGLGVARGLAQLNLHWMKYLVLTGERLDAEQARLAGLVNVVTPAGGHVEEAERLAAAIATKAPLALEVGKALLNRSSSEAYAHAADAVPFLMGTEDCAAGIAAFKARQTPKFQGR